MKQQSGRTILGFIMGVVVGLAAALAVAVYVTKVPIPFVYKGQSRSADQDVAETQKNKNWIPTPPCMAKTRPNRRRRARQHPQRLSLLPVRPRALLQRQSLRRKPI